MSDVKVSPAGKDRYLGALAKALAVEAAGFATVGGATHDSMMANGFYLLRFSNDRQLEEFKRLITTYLPPNSVSIEKI